MKPVSRGEIYRAEAARRRKRAALLFEQKVEIMKKLQEMGRVMLAARKRRGHAKKLREGGAPGR